MGHGREHADQLQAGLFCRDAKTADLVFGKTDLLIRHEAVFEDQLTGHAGLLPHLVLFVAEGEALHPGLDGKHDQVVLRLSDIFIADKHVPGAHMAGRYKHLAAVDHIAAGDLFGLRPHFCQRKERPLRLVCSCAGFCPCKRDGAGAAHFRLADHIAEYPVGDAHVAR